MNSDVEFYIKEKVPWHKLPQNIKQFLGNSQKEYEKVVINFRIKNQLKFPRNIVRRCLKEQQYYEDMLAYSQSSLLLYPYHLSSYIVKGLRLTPFQYYTKVLESLMDNEGSYDSLPNFTAADCLRLLGIGRNEYIDLMNQCRSRRKLFRKKNIRELLPQKPIDIHIEPWWIVQAGCIVEDDMKFVTEQEKSLIDLLYDHGAQTVGTLSFDTVHKLYKKGLIYLDVPIEKDDVVVVPPLKGFVMNRVLGDSFENLLYKIFVSIDEHTTVGELAGVLQINFKLVKRAVSLYCRLGFAKKKYSDSDYVDWNKGNNSSILSPTKVISSFSKVYNTEGSTEEEQKTKIAFLFDSTLTAFLMMGNLSPGLKNHAVTMFEVGKLTDESMDSFLCELEKVSTARDDSEGEARRYFEHALILRSTVIALRHRGLDLVRCESLQSLDKEMCSRLLNKNYGLLVSMAPLSGEVTPIVCENLPHLGPPCPQAHSPWFKLYLYHVTGSGPPSILFTRGTRITKLPSILKSCDKVLVTSWGHDATVIPISNLLFSLNDALTYSPVLVQVHGKDNNGVDTHLIPFPFDNRPDGNMFKFHPAVVSLMNELDMQHTCGYITMIKVKSPNSPSKLQIKDTLSLPLKLHDHLPHLDTPATPSSVEAWLHTISSEGGEFNMKQFSVTTLKEEDEDDDEPVGVTNEDCAQMLGNAVDGLDSSESSPSRESEPKVLSPPPSLMIDLSERRNSCSPINLDEWSLLECSFGIPLFDENVNKTICKSVVEKLILPQNLQKLIVSNDALSSKLVSFINQVQSWGEKSWSTVKNDNDWPIINVMFNDGQLFPWDGK